MERVRVQTPTLQIIDSNEVRTIREWENSYPETWLFIEVTREDVWEVYEGKLAAIAEDPMEFLEIDQEYDQRGIVTLTTQGSSKIEPPAVIPTFTVLHS